RSASTETGSPTPASTPEQRARSRSTNATAPRRPDRFPHAPVYPASAPAFAARVPNRCIAESLPPLRQHALQFLLGFKQPRLRCPFGDLQNRRDLRVLQTLHLKQQEHHPVLRMDSPERVLDRHLQGQLILRPRLLGRRCVRFALALARHIV